jgi:ring-1,2-phenylacetyl-CoA epoxidase subunit PaaA
MPLLLPEFLPPLRRKAVSTLQVKTVEEFRTQPEEYRTAVSKIVVSHAINELHGARTFDEPAVALAATPYAKWLTCRIAMEEYGHHCRFFELGRNMGLDAASMLPESTKKRTLSVFDFPINDWETFVANKLLGDLAEILQVEDLLHCSFVPLRNLARSIMPEEKFHHQFGIDFGREIVKTAEGKAKLQASVDTFFPVIQSFFGRPGSKNNEMFRRWGIKIRTNEGMRADYVKRAAAACDELGIVLPPVPNDALH